MLHLHASRRHGRFGGCRSIDGPTSSPSSMRRVATWTDCMVVAGLVAALVAYSSSRLPTETQSHGHPRCRPNHYGSLTARRGGIEPVMLGY